MDASSHWYITATQQQAPHASGLQRKNSQPHMVGTRSTSCIAWGVGTIPLPKTEATAKGKAEIRFQFPDHVLITDLVCSTPRVVLIMSEFSTLTCFLFRRSHLVLHLSLVSCVRTVKTLQCLQKRCFPTRNLWFMYIHTLIKAVIHPRYPSNNLPYPFFQAPC